MSSQKKSKQLRISHQDGTCVLHLGEMEIWDGADLALLRETLTRMIVDDRCRSVGVDMSTVKYVPSGFFGMLYDWSERGIRIRLLAPLPHVQRMLWFVKFFVDVGNDLYQLQPETATVPTPLTHHNTVQVNIGA